MREWTGSLNCEDGQNIRVHGARELNERAQMRCGMMLRRERNEMSWQSLSLYPAGGVASPPPSTAATPTAIRTSASDVSPPRNPRTLLRGCGAWRQDWRARTQERAATLLRGVFSFGF